MPESEAAGEQRELEREPSGEDSGKGSGPFGGLSPQEAGRRRHLKPSDPAAETDPVGKTRKALEKKAGAGDVYAARELRENADHYYGSAVSQGGLAVLTDEQLAQLETWIQEGVARQG